MNDHCTGRLNVNAKWLSVTATLSLAMTAVASIYLAYEYEPAVEATVIRTR